MKYLRRIHRFFLSIMSGTIIYSLLIGMVNNIGILGWVIFIPALIILSNIFERTTNSLILFLKLNDIISLHTFMPDEYELTNFREN